MPHMIIRRPADLVPQSVFSCAKLVEYQPSDGLELIRRYPESRNIEKKALLRRLVVKMQNVCYIGNMVV